MQSCVRRAAARSAEREPCIISSTAYKCESGTTAAPPPHSCATLLTVLLKAFVEIKGLLGLSLKRLLLAPFQETALTFYQQVLLSSLLMASFDLTCTLLQVLKQLLKQTTKPVLFPFLIHRKTQSKLLTPGF